MEGITKAPVIEANIDHGRRAEQSHGRAIAVDFVKLIAAAAVVWIHTTDCEESRRYLPLCRFAVPFFTCAAVYFVMHKATTATEASFIGFALHRARRIYVPFLLWSLLYLAVRVVKHVFVADGSPIVLSPAMFLNGSAHHLWFLPFICAVSIFTFAAGRATRNTPSRRMTLAIISFVAGTVFAFIPSPVVLQPTEVPISYFIDQVWRAVPSVFLGAGVFWVLERFQPGPQLRGIALAVAIFCILFEFAGPGTPLGPHLAGAGLLLFTATQRNHRWMRGRNWAELSFLIYLVHVLFLETLHTVVVRLGGVATVAADLARFALAFVISAIAADLMLRWRNFRAETQAA